MHDELLLFLVLCLIYLTDCLLWVGNHSIAFVAWGGTRWKDKTPSPFLETYNGGIIILNPLPPLGKVLSCHLPPFSISPKGICSLNSQILPHTLIPKKDITAILFDEMDSVKAIDRDLFVNERRYLRFSRSAQATRAAALMNLLLPVTEADRERIIEQFWDEQFDVESAGGRLREALHDLKYLKMLCNAMFFYLFAVAPALLFYFPSSRTLIPIGIGMLAIAIQISIEYFLLHKRIYVAAREERITNTIKMVLCPPVSIRACDLISQDLLASWNPIVIGHLTLSPQRYEEFATRTLRHLRYPLEDHLTDERVNDIRKWQEQILLRKGSDYFVGVAKLSDDLLRQPAPDDGSVRSYCPRCLSQFTKESGLCPDCGGIGLVPFCLEITTPGPKELNNGRVL